MRRTRQGGLIGHPVLDDARVLTLLVLARGCRAIRDSVPHRLGYGDHAGHDSGSMPARHLLLHERLSQWSGSENLSVALFSPM